MTRKHREIGFALALDAQDPVLAEKELVEQIVHHLLEHMLDDVDEDHLIGPERLAEMVGNQIIEAIEIGFRVGRSWQTKYESAQRTHDMLHGASN